MDLQTILKRVSSVEDLAMPKTRKSSPRKIAKKKAAPKKVAQKKESGSLDINSPELAQKMLDADVARILKKVREKRPLTSSERNFLEQRTSQKIPSRHGVDESPDFVTSVAALCGVLGVDRTTYYYWRKKFGDDIPVNRTNGSYDVLAWKEFIKRKGLVHGFDTVDDDEDEEDLDSLKKRDLKARAEEREFKVSVLKGDYIHKDDVQESIQALVSESIKLLRDKFENELPPVCAGLDAIGVREENSKAIDEVCKILHEGGGNEKS